MILLPGQTANATVKRDSSNNVIYGTTGTDDTSDKIVYSRGVNANIPQIEDLVNTGTSTVNKADANRPLNLTFVMDGTTLTLPASGLTGYVLQAGAIVCDVPNVNTIRPRTVYTTGKSNTLYVPYGNLPAATGYVLRTTVSNEANFQTYRIDSAVREDGLNKALETNYSRGLTETIPTITSSTIDTPARSHDISIDPAAPLTVQNTANWNERNVSSGSVGWNTTQNIPITFDGRIFNVSNLTSRSIQYTGFISDLNSPTFVSTLSKRAEGTNYYVFLYRVILQDTFEDTRKLTNVLDSVDVKSTRLNSDSSSYIAEGLGKNTTLALTQTN